MSSHELALVDALFTSRILRVTTSPQALLSSSSKHTASGFFSSQPWHSREALARETRIDCNLSHHALLCILAVLFDTDVTEPAFLIVRVRNGRKGTSAGSVRIQESDISDGSIPALLGKALAKQHTSPKRASSSFGSIGVPHQSH